MSQVKTVSKMFANCGLKELDFSNWKFYNKEINCSGFFQFSDKLNKIKGLDTLFGTIEDMQNGTYGTVSAGGAISMFEGTSLFNSENLLDDDGLTSTVRYWGLPFKDVSSLENFFAATKISKIGLVTRDDNYLNYSFGHNNL